MSRTVALIPAAGIGVRFGAGKPKQYVHLAGQSVLAHTVQRLAATGCFDALAVVLAVHDEAFEHIRLPAHCVRLGAPFRLPATPNPLQTPVLVLRCGGDTRAQTVANGVNALLAQGIVDAQDRIAVHDAARCCIDAAAVQRLLAADAPHGALLAVPVADTLKQADAAQCSVRTVARDGLWQAQTPQVFQAALLQRALATADLNAVTDEASAVEALGLTPQLVLGDARNLKLTTAADAVVMELLLNKDNAVQQRIGQGYDVHRLVAGRPLILGGVTIPFDKGLAGHSDADALLHAVTDAVLGAAGLGDIGTHFPDTDAAYRGADSRELLRQAYAKVKAAGWRVVNLDCTVIAQQPKLAPHIPAMKHTMAADLGIAVELINIKGKTNEKLGYLGREEAIEAQAAVLLQGVGG